MEGKQATHKSDVAMCCSERMRKDYLQTLQVVAPVVEGLSKICELRKAGVEVSSPDGCGSAVSVECLQDQFFKSATVHDVKIDDLG